jgi:hypothetical protein
MNRRLSTLWATAAGLALTCPALGLAQGPLRSTPTPEPGRLGVAGPALPAVTGASANQQVADAIAARLRQSGRLRGYAIDITFADGTAQLSGQMATVAQRDEAVALTQAVAGVRNVLDRLSVAAAPQVMQVQAPAPPGPPAPPAALPSNVVTPPLPGGLPPEPAPIFQPQPPLPGMVTNPPPLPPYAWPTYAPYNNFSRVAYPDIYPYQAWPFIGPVYPFPKVPLGWRSIKLTWEDGNWWYARAACGHDWWRIRYW